MVTKAYKIMMAAIFDLSKIKRIWIENSVLCDKNAKYWKENEK